MNKYTHGIIAALLALSLSLTACSRGDANPAADTGEPADRTYQLVGFIHGYYGVGGAIDGVKNPELTARAGEVVRIILINGELMPHDIAMKEHKVRSREVLRKDERTSVTFTATMDDTYYCTIPGHVQTGMIGNFRIVPAPENPASEYTTTE
jgi:uncharacterized cupredoxin-like copper-binding protein